MEGMVIMVYGNVCDGVGIRKGKCYHILKDKTTVLCHTCWIMTFTSFTMYKEGVPYFETV